MDYQPKDTISTKYSWKSWTACKRLMKERKIQRLVNYTGLKRIMFAHIAVWGSNITLKPCDSGLYTSDSTSASGRASWIRGDRPKICWGVPTKSQPLFPHLRSDRCLQLARVKDRRPSSNSLLAALAIDAREQLVLQHRSSNHNPVTRPINRQIGPVHNGSYSLIWHDSTRSKSTTSVSVWKHPYIKPRISKVE